ncbi:hypothetical protein [Leptothrix discophora]|uniref:Uncharacterized protein n=1 Tax=Leptothrix discophora TaxID=89 RepID=A0ABT9G0C0_LEPDI|nr:hypothetical protein [Leptothrix discophora]MDP4299926.1 hypothetical protein [Leptothrix discophora]
MSDGNLRLFIDLETRARKFITEWSLEFKERVEDKTPVVTGNLKNGYFIVNKQSGFEFSNIEEYFGYVENGTLHFAPRRMVGRTLLEAEDISQVAMEKINKK